MDAQAPGGGDSPPRLLLTGAPGSGKTTAIIRAAELLRARGCRVHGFWTQEVRRGGVRQGFTVELTGGARELLASVQDPGPPRVGRYGVRLEVVDRIVVPEIERAIGEGKHHPDTVLVMDEIGKMELFSEAFQHAVLAAFESPVRIIAAVMQKSHPFVDGLKARPGVALLSVTRENRDELPEQIVRAWSVARGA